MSLQRWVGVIGSYLVVVLLTYAALAVASAFMHLDFHHLIFTEWVPLTRLIFLGCCIWHGYWLRQAVKRKGWI